MKPCDVFTSLSLPLGAWDLATECSKTLTVGSRLRRPDYMNFGLLMTRQTVRVKVVDLL